MLCVCFLVVANCHVLISFSVPLSDFAFIPEVGSTTLLLLPLLPLLLFSPPFSFATVAMLLNCSFTSRLLERVITVVLLCQRCAFLIILFILNEPHLPNAEGDRGRKNETMRYACCYIHTTNAPDNNGNISNLFYCYYSIDLQLRTPFCPVFILSSCCLTLFCTSHDAARR